MKKIIIFGLTVLCSILFLACEDKTLGEDKNSSSSQYIQSFNHETVVGSSSSNAIICWLNSSSSAVAVEPKNYTEIKIDQPTNTYDIRWQYQDSVTGQCLASVACNGPTGAWMTFMFEETSKNNFDKGNIEAHAKIKYQGLPDQILSIDNIAETYTVRNPTAIPDQIEVDVFTEVDTLRFYFENLNFYGFEFIIVEDDELSDSLLTISTNDSIKNVEYTREDSKDFKWIMVKATNGAYYHIGYALVESFPQFDELYRENPSEYCQRMIAVNCQDLDFWRCYELYMERMCETNIQHFRTEPWRRGLDEE